MHFPTCWLVAGFYWLLLGQIVARGERFQRRNFYFDHRNFLAIKAITVFLFVCFLFVLWHQFYPVTPETYWNHSPTCWSNTFFPSDWWLALTSRLACMTGALAVNFIVTNTNFVPSCCICQVVANWSPGQCDWGLWFIHGALLHCCDISVPVVFKLLKSDLLWTSTRPEHAD